MKNLLLDSHTLLWLAGGVKIGPKTLEAIHQADIVYVSALTILELRLKHTSGKLPEAEEIIRSIDTMGLLTLEFNENQSRSYRLFTPANRDPFDNALVSIALQTKTPFITADRHILSLNVAGLTCLDARQ